MQRSRTRYAPRPEVLPRPPGRRKRPRRACNRRAAASGKGNRGSSIDEVDEAKGGDGQFNIKLDQGCKPLVMTHGALRAPTIGYVLTSLLTT